MFPKSPSVRQSSFEGSRDSLGRSQDSGKSGDTHVGGRGTAGRAESALSYPYYEYTFESREPANRSRELGTGAVFFTDTLNITQKARDGSRGR